MRGRDELTGFYDFPSGALAELARHQSDRVDACDHPPSHAAVERLPEGRSALYMTFQLGQCAETRWNRLRGFKKLGKVIEGVKFEDGIEVNQSTDQVAA